MNYDDFLHSKIQIAPNSGFSVSAKDIHPALKPHQRDAVMWAIRGGRRALFDPFGGLATVPMMAVRMGRKGYGCELNSGYFADGVTYLRAEETDIVQPSLFDLIGQEEYDGLHQNPQGIMP